MSKHLGDFDTSTVVYGKFTTYRPSTGAAFTLGGTPALSVYKDNSTTQSTTGVTLTADFDSVTGLNHFAIDTSADGTFYSSGSFFDIVITTGTVDSVSVVGAVVGSFTLRKNSALKPTTAGRALDVSAGGEAGIDWANVGSPTTTVNLSGTTVGVIGTGGIEEGSFATTAGSFYPLGIIDQGTAQSATATTLVLRAAAAFANDELIGATIVITGGSAGVGQARTITDYVSASDTATVDTWTTTPTGTITYKIFATAAGAGSGLDAAGVRAALGFASASYDTDITGLNTKLDAIDDFVDTEVAAIKAKTDNLPSDPADQSLIIAATDAITALLGTPAGASVSADIAAVKTDTAAILTDTGTTLDAAIATIDTNVDAIKAKTDSLTFTAAGFVDANVQKINDVTITGDGQVGTEFGV